MRQTGDPHRPLSPAQAHGGLVLVVLQAVIAPLALDDPTSVTAIALQASFHLLLVLLLVGVGARRALLVMCVALILAATLMRAVVSESANAAHVAADLALALSGSVALVLTMRRLYEFRSVGPAMISVAVMLYMLSGVLWAILFHAIELVSAGAFVGPVPNDPVTAGQLYYFSLVTLTTLGYGDISPAIPATRALCTVEAVFGQVFLIVLLGRLVSLQISSFDKPGSASRGHRTEGPRQEAAP